ncbi:hypothetical protein [Jiangella alba]|uniref:Uncharacterized protein n=1 Tax=Jiangella alba TaxID=561176 RepID=A0A1H5PJZ4_9ACTN|nr:hypothetical protein [Jiangella alba]SEF14242.1 hypothetical protein SAMN04488561_4587 [Jiangella alba]
MDLRDREVRLTDGNIVLNEHADDAGLCAVCGSAWPCDATLLVSDLY